MLHNEKTQAMRELERKMKELQEKMKRRKLSQQIKEASKNPAISVENREKMKKFDAKQLQKQTKKVDVKKIFTKEFVDELKGVRSNCEQGVQNLIDQLPDMGEPSSDEKQYFETLKENKAAK
jgi:hypothetical protein